jgi:peptide/nickel transport system substrate-binding protein
VDSLGQYGGIWHAVSWWPGISNVLLKMYDPPIRWKEDYSGYELGLADDYHWSADGKTFTLHLRQGIKWSDGVPYTSEDWRFWWEDLAMNENYAPAAVPGYLRKSNGEPIEMRFLDGQTIVWISDRAQWVQPFFMAQGYWEFANGMMKPAHYLKQFHPTYTAGATYAELEAKDRWWENPDFPTLLAWHCTQVDTSGANQVNIFSRNPYYWKVDPNGKQLPYIDRIEVEIMSDATARLLNCAAGKYDAVFRGCGSHTDMPFLEQHTQAGGYHLQPGWMNGAGAWPGYMVNQDYVEGGGNYADDTPEHAAEIRALLRDTRFRKALSAGFNRQQVIDVAWNGSGEPKAATISPQSLHFAGVQGHLVYQNWSAADAQENLTTANALLDAAGMLDRNSDGWRDLPSGKAFTLLIDMTDWGGSYEVQLNAATEIAAQWGSNLHIQVQVNDLQGDPQVDARTNEGYFMLRAAHISELDLWTYPDWVFPVTNRYMFPLAGRWYASGKDTCVPTPGQPYSCGLKPEPGSPAARLQALYELGLVEPDFDARNAIIWEAIQLIIDEGPFVIGVAGDRNEPVVVKNNFHNVPEYGVLGPWAPASPGNMHPEQFWIGDYVVNIPFIQK